MAAYYLSLRSLHIACVFVSIGLFVLRHVLTLRGVAWRKSVALRVMPHVVDSVLLASAIALCFAIEQFPFARSWLTVKLIALVAYIFLGMIALNPSRTVATRRITFIAAVAVFAFIVSVARTHDPLGALSRFF